MGIGGEILRTGAEVVAVLLLIALGAYLRERTYYYSRHPDRIPSLWEWLRDIIENRKEKKGLKNK